MENKAAAEGPPPKKRRRRNEDSQAEFKDTEVPIDSDMTGPGMTNLQNEEEEENGQEIEIPLASTKLTEPSTKLKDLFAPREEKGNCFFKILLHLMKDA
jgi:hypothetical protein